MHHKRKMNVDSLTDDVQAFVLSITIEVFAPCTVLYCTALFFTYCTVLYCTVMSITIEVFVPLCYAVSFSLAYTGPNASVMGNVSRSSV